MRGPAGALSPARLRRLRLAAQRLTPETAAPDAAAAARAVIGVQAQDVRAAGLALRSRVPGLTRAEVDAAPLVRTWTVRGTVHLLCAEDLRWLEALTRPKNRRTFDAIMVRREAIGVAEAMLEDIGAILAGGPRSRADLLAELAAQGHGSLGDYAVNVFAPWGAARGVLVSRADGLLCAPPPHAPVGEEEALATLGRRYLEGYGPATEADLAKWSGLGLGAARRALGAVPEAVRAGELHALPEQLEAEPPPAPPPRLLAGFDTLMLGWATRALFATPEQDAQILRGGGMIRPVVLAGGRTAATWKLAGSGARRRIDYEWFGRPAAAEPLAAEERDVGRFLAGEA